MRRERRGKSSCWIERSALKSEISRERSLHTDLFSKVTSSMKSALFHNSQSVVMFH